jgi:hypothetical protein
MIYCLRFLMISVNSATKDKKMDRRRFLKSAAASGLTAGLCKVTASATVPEHNWNKYDWGSGPAVADRLYQGPFPQYGPCAIVPESDVWMVTSPSKDIVSNYGMGLMVYASDDTGPLRVPGESTEKTLEDLIKLPFAQKIYIRPNWRDVQKRPGRLDFPEWWSITFDLARRYNKRIGFRVMLENPDFPDPGMPDFLLDKVPYVKLKGEWKGNQAQMRYRKDNRVPRYDHPAYQAAFRELNELLAVEFNGHPQIEFMDTIMYGFWGEGHTWPFEGNPFPSQLAAEQIWSRMFEQQLEQWTKVPLATNTQPDFSNVGNADLLDRTMRTGNWLRTDTIFIENTQIEALSYRPPWAAAICEVGFTTGDPKDLRTDEDGITYNEQIITHAADAGVNYLSLWSWHSQSAANILSYYEKFPAPIDEVARKIGYRVRPSFIWTFLRDGAPGLVVGLANDGIAPIPGVLRLSVVGQDDKTYVSGCVDAGYPKPNGVHQAMLLLPAGVRIEGLRLKAELEVKGVRYPVRWACRQKINPDGSLTLRHNYKPDDPLV